MMSSRLRQFVSEEFCEVYILFSFSGSFCCLFVIIVLQKDVMMVKGDANEDVMFSRLISYKFNGFKTGFLKLFVKLVQLVFNVILQSYDLVSLITVTISFPSSF